MKKALSVLFAMTLMASLVACGNATPGSGESAGSRAPAGSAESSSVPAEASSSEAVPQSADAAPDSEPEAAAEEAGNTLVAYFSWSGNTRGVAQLIAEETGGDLFEIATLNPYTDDYNELLDIARQEQSDKARPELNGQVENWDSYRENRTGFW